MMIDMDDQLVQIKVFVCTTIVYDLYFFVTLFNLFIYSIEHSL